MVCRAPFWYRICPLNEEGFVFFSEGGFSPGTVCGQVEQTHRDRYGGDNQVV